VNEVFKIVATMKTLFTVPERIPVKVQLFIDSQCSKQ